LRFSFDRFLYSVRFSCFGGDGDLLRMARVRGEDILQDLRARLLYGSRSSKGGGFINALPWGLCPYVT